MKIEESLLICQELIMGSGLLARHFTKWIICGSIRRRVETVHDIDIVAIVKPESEYKFGEMSLSTWIKALDPNGEADGKQQGAGRFLDGKLIKRFLYKGIMVDVYLSDETTFGTLTLIRTGSKEHNIRLTTLARSKDLKLFASGKGLCKIKGGLYNNEPEEITEIIENTEDGILNNLLGRIPLPEQRN